MRNDDPAKWNMALFQEDMDAHRALDWPTRPAISYIPAPVAPYESPGGSVRNIALAIGDKHIHGFSVAWGRGDFNTDLFKAKNQHTRVYFNILILTDDPDPMLRASRIVSRNHPHYTASGTQRTAIGDIDWVQMGLANGDNYAIVSQRVFDLNFGRTILIAPQADGSLRFMQRDSHEAHDEQFNDFLHRLEQDEDVVAFFNRAI